MLSDEQRDEIIQAALSARRMAYAPYSYYPVGAALLTSTGEVYTGVNVENAAYPTSICAERVAVFKAVSEGKREFLAIVVATNNGGTPCGSCRQVLAEFGQSTLVIVVDGAGRVVQEAPVSTLLPGAFTPSDLPGRPRA
ncbi:MAG TPA: cytidine deaminase [Anaerolineales bacterium]|nr:cytidine deaminase [Anaerolineales bacterium]